MKTKTIVSVLLVFCLWQNTSIAQRTIERVAHRGANRMAPENTLASAALSLGVDFLEVDVRRSKDGVYFAIHDATLDRTTNGIGNFRDEESTFLKQLDAGSWFRHSFKGEHMPPLKNLSKNIKTHL